MIVCFVGSVEDSRVDGIEKPVEACRDQQEKLFEKHLRAGESNS